ncbi:MAG TPA: response regulator [Nitrospiraceae bacterium]|jgi:DNA-binding NarL/FixJ family response regulator|nr:response regulator [Nitrospiraceae bacterium]
MASAAPATVLLIDGFDKDRTYYADRLKASLSNCDVLEARDGQSGLALHASRHVDCIVTELDLTDLSAFEVLLRAVPVVKHQSVAVIMLARAVIPSIANLAKRYGAQAVLVKQLTSGDELATAILTSMAIVASIRMVESR